MSDGMLEIEKVLDRRKIDGKVEYLLKYKGVTENFWVSGDNINADVIEDYYREDYKQSELKKSINRTNPPTTFLKPPPLEKQFLISPPCSPPVGWEPAPEATPLINYELLAAISRLAPGEPLTLHSGNDGQPEIVVHVCDDVDNNPGPKGKMPQTPRPPSQT